MKKTTTWIIAVVIIIVLILGYVGRHQIKSLISGSSANPAPTNQTATTPTESPMTANESASPSATMELNNAIVTTKTDPTKGAFLADTKGMTLYTYDKDTNGISNCYGGCAKAWPIYTAPAEATNLPADFTVVKRTDGTQMYAYDGMPLYYYATDSKPGDITGDGVGGVWHLVKP